MRRTLFNIAFLIIFSALAGGACLFSIKIAEESWSQQALKFDYAELSDIKYGLLSVNSWKQQLGKIIQYEIAGLKINKANINKVRKYIEEQLDVFIDQVAQRIKDSNRDTTKGKIKQAFVNMFIDFKQIKEGIPVYADAIIEKMANPDVEREIKILLQKQASKYLSSTYELSSDATLSRIFLATESKSIAEAKVKIKDKILQSNLLLYTWGQWLVLISVVTVLLGLIFRNSINGLHLFLIIITLFALLFSGLASPMLDMEAKISSLSFKIAGYPIQFTDQVFYFQSKGILDVFWLLVTDSDPKTQAVGIFVVIFSVILPVVKMLTSWIAFVDVTIGQVRLRDSRIVKYLIFKAGKWSLTDVFVVAIFMAFIGLNGVITSQLAKFNQSVEGVSMLTTNGTALKHGFYLFTCYAILSLFISTIIKYRIMHKSEDDKAPNS